MDRDLLKMALILGLMSTIGPFAIDMYLPALPTIAADFGVEAGGAQLTLTAYFIAFGVSQLFYGPASDMFGRKPPIYFGIVLFALASIGCALAPSIEILAAVAVLPGPRRGRRHVDPARHHPRPLYRRQGDAADVDDHAGHLDLADAGAAGRLADHRAVRLARRLSRRHAGGGRGAAAARLCPARNPAAGTARAVLVLGRCSGASARCCAIPASWA